MYAARCSTRRSSLLDFVFEFVRHVPALFIYISVKFVCLRLSVLGSRIPCLGNNTSVTVLTLTVERLVVSAMTSGKIACTRLIARLNVHTAMYYELNYHVGIRFTFRIPSFPVLRLHYTLFAGLHPLLGVYPRPRYTLCLFALLARLPSSVQFHKLLAVACVIDV